MAKYGNERTHFRREATIATMFKISLIAFLAFISACASAAVGTVMISKISGSIVAGSTDGSSSTATFNEPYGITLNGMTMLITDNMNNKIRKIDLTSNAVSTLKLSGTPL